MSKSLGCVILQVLKPLGRAANAAWLTAMMLQMHSLPAAIATQTAARVLETAVARARMQGSSERQEVSSHSHHQRVLLG